MKNNKTRMRAIDCPCGAYLVSPSDEQLFELASVHRKDHPQEQIDEEKVKELIAANAYDVEL